MALQGLGASLRRIATAATTPLVPADYVDIIAPLKGSTLRGRLVSVTAETATATTITLLPGRGWNGHRPGQFLQLGVDINGVRHWRSYSITSRPQNHLLTITVKRQGLVSEYLAQATKGDIVLLDQAAGDFVLPQDAPAKTLFITAGSGITPVMGILRSHELTDVVVFHSARTPEDVIFGAELRALATDGCIRLIERHTATDGRIEPADITGLVPDIAERTTYVCGPNDLIDAVEAQFTASNWNAPTHERFRPVLAAVGEGGPVRFDRCGVEVEASGSTSLLETGEAAGVLLPFGCRMGVCYGCVTPLASGSVRDLRDGTVTSADDHPVLIQTCINAAAGPAVLDA